LTLTAAGQTYLAACRRILDEVGEAERAAAGEYSAPKGELVVTAPIVFGRLHVLPVVADFLAAYPEVDIRLTLSDQITQLVDEHIDLAVRIGDLPDSSLV
ncbi:LysR family transcriptional regulator, partial [bacterium M00.F.Ca.ET.229.01.1.1]